MRTNRNNKMMMDYNKLYMSFVIEEGNKKDIMKSVWNYAQEACRQGADFIKKNLISCKTANTSSIYWDYEEAQEEDWFCKFCCGAKGSDMVVNGFINSRHIDDADSSNCEVFYVRLSLNRDAKVSSSNWFNGKTGSLRNMMQAQDFDEAWLKISGYQTALYAKQYA